MTNYYLVFSDQYENGAIVPDYMLNKITDPKTYIDIGKDVSEIKQWIIALKAMQPVFEQEESLQKLPIM